MGELCLKLKDAYIMLIESSNPPIDSNASYVIGIYSYDLNGNEHPSYDGGEMDVMDEKPIQDHIEDALEFIDIPRDTHYEIVDEDDLPIDI